MVDQFIVSVQRSCRLVKYQSRRASHVAVGFKDCTRVERPYLSYWMLLCRCHRFTIELVALPEISSSKELTATSALRISRSPPRSTTASPVGQIRWSSFIGAVRSSSSRAATTTSSSTALASVTHLSIVAPFLSYHPAFARPRRFLPLALSVVRHGQWESLVRALLLLRTAGGWWPAAPGFVRPACTSAKGWVITRNRVITQPQVPAPWPATCASVDLARVGGLG